MSRVTWILENSLEPLLTLEGTSLRSKGRKGLETPRLATYFLWGKAVLWERLGSQKPGPLATDVWKSVPRMDRASRSASESRGRGMWPAGSLGKAVLSKAVEQGKSTKGGGRAAKGRREELLWEVTWPQGWSRSLTRYGKTQ